VFGSQKCERGKRSQGGWGVRFGRVRGGKEASVGLTAGGKKEASDGKGSNGMKSGRIFITQSNCMWCSFSYAPIILPHVAT
jgi:hypothetical protein